MVERILGQNQSCPGYCSLTNVSAEPAGWLWTVLTGAHPVLQSFHSTLVGDLNHPLTILPEHIPFPPPNWTGKWSHPSYLLLMHQINEPMAVTARKVFGALTRPKSKQLPTTWADKRTDVVHLSGIQRTLKTKLNQPNKKPTQTCHFSAMMHFCH